MRGPLSRIRLSLRGHLVVLVTAVPLPVTRLAVWLTATVARRSSPWRRAILPRLGARASAA